LSGDAPVVVSHAGCRAVADVRRNLGDDQLRAVAERGGVLGVMALPLTVDPFDRARWTLDRLVDHVDHAVGGMGIDHVGLGGDFVMQIARSGCLRPPTAGQALLPDGLPFLSALDGLAGPEGYPNLVEALRRRGYEGDRLAAVLGGNLMRLFRE